MLVGGISFFKEVRRTFWTPHWFYLCQRGTFLMGLHCISFDRLVADFGGMCRWLNVIPNANAYGSERGMLFWSV